MPAAQSKVLGNTISFVKIMAVSQKPFVDWWERSFCFLRKAHLLTIYQALDVSSCQKITFNVEDGVENQE